MDENEIISLFYDKQDAITLDDCATLEINSKYSIHTTDCISQNTHFRLDWSSPQNLANKLIQCNLSDMISSAGQARYAFLNLGLPSSIGDSFIRSFASSLRQGLHTHGIVLKGGDTFKCDLFTACLHIVGVPTFSNYPKGLQRNTGSEGDFVYVTGNVGRSLIGLKILENKLNKIDKLNEDTKTECVKKHLSPSARFDLVPQIFEFETITAMMDLSDGLLQDTKKLAQASNISIHLQLEKIPIHSGLKNTMKILDAMSSGEELELLFLSSVERDYTDSTCIGRAVGLEKNLLRIFNKDHEITQWPDSFSHFRD